MKEKLFSTTGIALPSVLKSFGDCVAVTDADFKFVAANQGMADFYGLYVDELLGKTAFDVYPQFHNSIFYENSHLTITEGRSTMKVGYSQNTKRWLMVRTAKVADGFSGIFTSNIDMASLNIGCRTAKYDSLTTLKNKDTFEKDLKTVYEEQRSEFGIVFVEVRDFLLFNDRYGTFAGNEVLLEVASRLRSAGGIFNQVYRVAANKFAVIIPMNRDGCIFEIHRLHDLLQSSFVVADGINTFIDTSIGFMYVDTFMHKTDYIIEEAEFALSQSKAILTTEIYHEHILCFALPT